MSGFCKLGCRGEHSSRDGTSAPWPASWETCMQVKKSQLELDMEQQAGSKLEKEHVKAVYCHPAYLTSLRSRSCETPDWMKHKLESRWARKAGVQQSLQLQRARHAWGTELNWTSGCMYRFELSFFFRFIRTYSIAHRTLLQCSAVT